MPMIESSRAMFVTTNTPLAQTTTSFFRDEYGTTTFAPLCMPIHQFGTLAWLKKPLSSPELPMKLVIADALAALDPPESLWKDYVREIAKLEAAGSISIEDCYLLKYSPGAKEALMGITVGGSRAFLQGSVPEIMARIRAAERREAEQQAVRERTLRETAEAEAATALADARSAHLADIEALTAKANEIASSSEERDAARRARYDELGLAGARLVTRGLLAAYLAVIAVQAYGLFPWRFLGNLPSDSSHPFVGVALTVVLILGTVLALRGRGLFEELESFEAWLGKGTARRISRLIERDPPARQRPE